MTARRQAPDTLTAAGLESLLARPAPPNSEERLAARIRDAEAGGRWFAARMMRLALPKAQR